MCPDAAGQVQRCVAPTLCHQQTGTRGVQLLYCGCLPQDGCQVQGCLAQVILQVQVLSASSKAQEEIQEGLMLMNHRQVQCRVAILSDVAEDEGRPR